MAADVGIRDFHWGSPLGPCSSAMVISRKEGCVGVREE
jgi:hypothetical protein